MAPACTVMSLSFDKRPRHYCAEIVQLETKEERRKALSEVPEIYRDWVRHLVTDHWLKNAKRQNR